MTKRKVSVMVSVSQMYVSVIETELADDQLFELSKKGGTLYELPDELGEFEEPIGSQNLRIIENTISFLELD